MPFSNLRVRDIENRWESISLCLQAIARWAGVELHFRSINASLGLSFMISAPRAAQVSLSWWMTFGRDLFLIETGKLFGLGFRRLELPESARTNPGSPQALQAYQETVRPLIAAALADDQPVLAWQGWPDYHKYLWGLLTSENDCELGFSGTTMWAGEKLLPHHRAAAGPDRLLLLPGGAIGRGSPDHLHRDDRCPADSPPPLRRLRLSRLPVPGGTCRPDPRHPALAGARGERDPRQSDRGRSGHRPGSRGLRPPPA